MAGEIIAEGSQGDLIQKVGEKDTILIKVGEDAEKAIQAAKQAQGVDSVTFSEGIVRILAGRGRQALPNVIKTLSEAGVVIQSVEVKEPNLEAVFLHLTGRALRD